MLNRSLLDAPCSILYVFLMLHVQYCMSATTTMYSLFMHLWRARQDDISQDKISSGS